MAVHVDQPRRNIPAPGVDDPRACRRRIRKATDDLVKQEGLSLKQPIPHNDFTVDDTLHILFSRQKKVLINVGFL